MNLLIITQKVDSNDSVLGFFHRWLEEMSRQFEKVTVICLYKGQFNLPPNVSVLSLGKEEGKSRLKYLGRFYQYIFQQKNHYDSVFVHMNEQYVVLGYLFWKLWGKKIGLWYAHSHVSFLLRISAKLADLIFTSTPSGFRLKSHKIRVVGQGIDTNFFKPSSNQINNSFEIISIGRISSVKKLEILIEAAKILRNKGLNFRIKIVGQPITDRDEIYFDQLQKSIETAKLSSQIEFTGAKRNDQLVELLNRANLFVSTSQTGSLDKAIMEAFSCALPVLTSNEAVTEALEGKNLMLIYPKNSPSLLATKIELMMKMSTMERQKLGKELREVVINGHSLEHLIRKIKENYESL